MTYETAKGLNALLDDLSARLGVSREEVMRRAIKLIEEDLDRTNGGVVLGRCRCTRCDDHTGRSFDASHYATFAEGCGCGKGKCRP